MEEIPTMKQKSSIPRSDIVFIVPAAGKVNSACNYKLAYEDDGFLNIGTSLAIDEIGKKSNNKIVLAVRSKNKKIYQLNQYKNIEIVEIGHTKNIIETIYKTLNFIDSEWVLINPITTIPTSDYPPYAFIEFGQSILPKENWSSIIFDKSKKPKFLSKLDKNSYNLKSYPFTGRILAKKKDIKFLIENLKEYEKNDLFILAKNLYLKSKVQIIFTNWLDIGHTATYPLTRISSITSRFFNTIIFDKEKNIIKKKSYKKKKISQEISFYKTMPVEIKRYFPMIFNVDYQDSYVSYEMDYVANPTLSEIYLFSKLGPNAILRIFNSIDRLLKIFYDKKAYTEENASWLYSDKTESRQDDIERIIQKKDFISLRNIYHNDFYVNDFKLPSLKKTYEILKEKLREFDKLRPLHIGHGDLCFNNILIDPIYAKVNLIDPKAEKHEKLNLYGLVDNYYDLSKLNHSICGLYDSVVNNLFHLQIYDFNHITFEIYKPKEYDLYNSYFKDVICDKRINSEDLKILTSNLFLTMIPFHLEDKRRIIGLALIGNILMNDHSMQEIII